MNLDAHLKDALRRTSPSEDFASRVMARIEEERGGDSSSAPHALELRDERTRTSAPHHRPHSERTRTSAPHHRSHSERTRTSAPHHTWRRVAAAVALTAILGGWAAHTVIERREGERAREEVLLAMHIAGAKVRAAQQQVRNTTDK